MDTNWDCEAYGPNDFGALCFFADPGTRNCRSREECSISVNAARRLLFDRIRELAAAGDPTGIDLAKEFTDPGQLLGGPGAITPEDRRTSHP
jgi:hypothetical protein